MHCYTEVAAGKARMDYDVSSFAANKLVKGGKGDDNYGANKGMGRLGPDSKDDAAG